MGGPCLLFDAASRPATRHAEMSHDAAGRGLIMVIEDEAAIADVIRLNLVKAGYGVHLERDGISGLAAIRSLKPAAVILDIGLPVLDGANVALVFLWEPVGSVRRQMAETRVGSIAACPQRVQVGLVGDDAGEYVAAACDAPVPRHHEIDPGAGALRQELKSLNIVAEWVIGGWLRVEEWDLHI